MYVRFWGTRGSIPAPGRQTIRYGGNTSCVEVRAADGTLLILDCGTGARELGLHLLRTASRPLRLNLLIGHTHWDHIQGFPFFVPAFHPDTELNIYAPLGFQRSMEDTLAGQMQYAYFPVKLHELRSRLHFRELEEGFFRVGEVLVETQYLNHTAPTIAYRLSSGGTTVAYVTDHEPFWMPAGQGFTHPGDQRHIAFLKGADLVIHDAQYSAEEYRSRVSWGHSSVEYATDVALAAGVRRLALFHHDPTHEDATMEVLQAGARARVAAQGGQLEVFAAAEGMELEVQGSGGAPAVTEASALQRRPIAGGRVLVVSAQAAEIAAIGQVLAEDELVLQVLPDQRTALARAVEVGPDLAIIDAHLPDGEGAALIRPLRARLRRRQLPILLLTEGPDTVGTLPGGEAAVTDYLAKPFSPPMLRARVRAWLARTLMTDRTKPAALSQRKAIKAVSSRRSPTEGIGSEPGTITRYASLLASVPTFRRLSREQLHRLVAQATEQVYSAGQALVRQGEPGDRLFVVLSGHVRVVEAAPEIPQGELFLGELGPGEIVGELGILRKQPRSATVLAVGRTHCLVLPKHDFSQVLQSSPDLAVALLRMLAERLHDADQMLARYAPDPLTGLASRRAFRDQYRGLAAGARLRHSGVLLLLLDILRLKTINDRYGYAIGDEVLRTVADALMEATHPPDLVSRSGGDEFAVLLINPGPHDIDVAVTHVREKLAELATRQGLPLAVSCSMGIASSHVPPENADELLREADRDMHRKKRDKKRE